MAEDFSFCHRVRQIGVGSSPRAVITGYVEVAGGIGHTLPLRKITRPFRFQPRGRDYDMASPGSDLTEMSAAQYLVFIRLLVRRVDESTPNKGHAER